ncbi:MAG: phosphatidylserine decarboxylase, partial [Planctomycetaceae bacterium]
GVLLTPDAMDPQITSIQPGGGTLMRLELAWGFVRRWWLSTFRAGYVRRMAESRQGTSNQCPHDVLDPRDVKYYRNQVGYWWDAADDPFAWRDRLPFARAGLAELLVFSFVCFGGAALLRAVLATTQVGTALSTCGWVTCAALLIIGVLIVWFFRDPPRSVTRGIGTIVSPADGKIVTIERIAHDEFVGGPAVLVGIFLSIFNVHINRAPFAARVIGLTYRPGKFLNALKPESARENERLEIRMQATEHPQYRFRVRQVSGAIARRIVCWVKPGDHLGAGEQFGMIKLGSRTELVLPDIPQLDLSIKVGDHVKAGTSVIGVFHPDKPAAAHGA